MNNYSWIHPWSLPCRNKRHIRISKNKSKCKLTRYYDFNSTELRSSQVLCYTSVVSWVNLLGPVFLQSTATFHTKFIWQRLVNSFFPSDGWFWNSTRFVTMNFSFMVKENVKFGLLKDNLIQICGQKVTLFSEMRIKSNISSKLRYSAYDFMRHIVTKKIHNR